MLKWWWLSSSRHADFARSASPNGKEAETEANQFAAAFLMPRAQTIATAPRSATLRACIQHKHVFGVSVAAYVRRLHTVGLLSDWHYRTLFIQLLKSGFRTAEPEPRYTNRRRC